MRERERERERERFRDENIIRREIVSNLEFAKSMPRGLQPTVLASNCVRILISKRDKKYTIEKCSACCIATTQ